MSEFLPLNDTACLNMPGYIVYDRCYHEKHSYSLKLNHLESDLEKADRILNLFKKRDFNHPHCGDRVILYGSNKGKEVIYKNGHLEDHSYKGKYCMSYCTEPYIPFINSMDETYGTSASGGYWGDLIKDRLKPLESSTKLFHVWGWNGPCADGTLTLKLPIMVWKYKNYDTIY